MRQLGYAAGVAVALVAGVWVTGGLIADDFWTSMALTTVWFAIAGLACLMLVRSRTRVRWAVLGSYVLTAGAIGVYLLYTTVHDKVVDERVATGVPVSRQAAAPPATPAGARSNVEVASGRFRSLEHDTAGRAAIVLLVDGRRVLTLTGFTTSAGPDLRVRLVRGDSTDGGSDGAIDLGGLKGNRGNQQYSIPRGAEVSDRTVVIWCRAFTAAFGAARLETS